MKRRLLKHSALLLCLILLCGCGSTGERRAGHARGFQVYSQGCMPLEAVEGFEGSDRKNYTLMVYMTGSNLESGFGRATEDIEEMLAAGADCRTNNVILYTGGSTRWLGSVPSDRNSVIDLLRPEGRRVVAQTEKNADMGEAETLSDFLNFTYENYPAEHYALILWDHGGGPIFGYGHDDLFSGDSLRLSEMYYAMEKTPFKDKKLDFVGFDACLMANLECMSLWQRYADYFIGSQELEPGDGWNYEFLSVLRDKYEPEELGEEIIKSFARYYEAAESRNCNPDLTLSLVSLNELSDVKNALGSFASVADKKILSPQNYQRLQKSRAGFKSMGLGDGDADSAFQYDLVDLGDLARGIGEDYQREMEELSAAIEKCVKMNYSNAERCCGMSVYCPFYNKALYTDNKESYKSICPSKEYWNLISSVSEKWIGSKSRDWELGTPVYENGEYCLRLTGEQLENCVGASYTVYTQLKEHYFIPLLSGIRICPETDGDLRIPSNPSVVHAMSSYGDRCPVCAQQLEPNRLGDVYRVFNTALQGGDNFMLYDSLSSTMEENQPVSFVLRSGGQGPEMEIQSVTGIEDGALGGRNTIDNENYEELVMIYEATCPGRDSRGTILPGTEWSRDYSEHSMSFMPVGRDLGFLLEPPGPEEGECFMQIDIEDVNGEHYASELVPARDENAPELYEEKCSEGTISYLVYPDHAELLSAEGSFESIELKSKVKGKTLTALLSHSMADIWELENVTLPEGLEYIGCAAFAGDSHLESINFPESLKQISEWAFYLCERLSCPELPQGLEVLGRGAFKFCSSLGKLILPKSLRYIGEGLVDLGGVTDFGPDFDAEGFKIIGGALFSPDGKTLIACPELPSGEYILPESTERIGPYAFRETGIKKVVLNKGLREICSGAFQNCPKLEFPELPESLERLGFNAFGSGKGGLELGQKAGDIPIITIGPKLKEICSGAFNGVAARSFRVSPENKRFISRDGNLLNAAGDWLIAFRQDGSGDFYMPSGIKEFDLENLDYVMDSEDSLSIILHLPEDAPTITGNTENHRFKISDSSGRLVDISVYMSNCNS